MLETKHRLVLKSYPHFQYFTTSWLDYDHNLVIHPVTFPQLTLSMELASIQLAQEEQAKKNWHIEHANKNCSYHHQVSLSLFMPQIVNSWNITLVK